MKRICVFLTEKQVILLRDQARSIGISMAELLRRFLDEALQKRKEGGDEGGER